MNNHQEKIPASFIHRYSSRRQPLDRSFLCRYLKDARAYDRIAGYFCSSIIEAAGEELESIQGRIRMVCNSDIQTQDLQTAKAAQYAVRQSWCASEPEKLLDSENGLLLRRRFVLLYDLLKSGKLSVKVLPDDAFGLIHGKAGVITLSDGSKTAFMGSANESAAAWRMNYELVWADRSPDAVDWIQEEFDALWSSPHAIPLAEFVIQDIKRLSERTVIPVGEWAKSAKTEKAIDSAPAVIETPVYRREAGLWEHQKYFVKKVIEAHLGPGQKARFILADQVGLGKTLQLAMSGLLISLTSDKPVLIICPKTLVWQWQGEMKDLLEMPSAVWNGRQWVDENGLEYPVSGVRGIRQCPRRVGVISSGLISRGSEAAELLMKMQYDLVILDEAHRARRRNLGVNRDNETPDPNNLLRFMHGIAERTRSLLLATATPVQLRPVEAWDLLDVLSRGDESVLGNTFSLWRHPADALALIMGPSSGAVDITEQWEWIRNPLPPRSEHRDFEILRRKAGIPDVKAVAAGDLLGGMRAPEKQRLEKLFPRYRQSHHPFIQRIIRRTREQLERQIDPETNEPLLQPIRVQLLGESDRDAVLLPPYLKEAYTQAELFCQELGRRMQGAGFMKTLLLRRVGSSIYSGLKTARKIMDGWALVEESFDEEDDSDATQEGENVTDRSISKTLTSEEQILLEKFIAALEANKDQDPKYAVVKDCLLRRKWLEQGCIVFSQYRDSIQWLAEQLTRELPDEPVAVYSGPQTSGVMKSGVWDARSREDLKKMVFSGQLRLMLGTDAASEGLNLQRLSTLINLDLPWNPTRLEQRKGRIQRIGQVHDTVLIYNLRYKDSVEDRVHQLLSLRMKDIFDLFGQIPDILEDVWVNMAIGDKEEAMKIIDEIPKKHPFQIRYSNVEKVDWETCSEIISNSDKRDILIKGWSSIS